MSLHEDMLLVDHRSRSASLPEVAGGNMEHALLKVLGEMQEAHERRLQQTMVELFVKYLPQVASSSTCSPAAKGDEKVRTSRDASMPSKTLSESKMVVMPFGASSTNFTFSMRDEASLSDVSAADLSSPTMARGVSLESTYTSKTQVFEVGPSMGSFCSAVPGTPNPPPPPSRDLVSIHSISASSRDADEEGKSVQFSTKKQATKRSSFAHTESLQRHRARSFRHNGVRPSEGSTRIRRLVEMTYFDSLATTVVVLNAVFIGLQMEFESSPGLEVANAVFGVLMVVEIVLRCLAEGIRNYLRSFWNWFDVVIVLSQTISFVLLFITLQLPTLGRLVSVLRLLRILRLFRILRFFRAFRILVVMVWGAITNGFGALSLLFLVIYIFAVYFAELASDHFQSQGADEEAPLARYYGSLPSVLLTLFMSIVGGVDWENVMVPLYEVGGISVALFLLFITFVQIVIMNVVTGFFLQCAIDMARNDEESVVRRRLQEKHFYAKRFRALFERLDHEHHGFLSLDEMEDQIGDENMQALLRSLDIDTTDAWTLFKLLDADSGGSVDMDEFVEGCIQLRGQARSIQMAQLMYHPSGSWTSWWTFPSFLNRKLLPPKGRD
eukprot:TRINITY_DN9926_c0_g2_i1.p1 TRINITY_DN9926_c0_g2~~TRINITY_DN9926_c0_g2_i1.p1  ORF type:complete len:610 (+),score=119.47 TRINITY_DN9926_c0_g2_i1:81-1910(+)